MHLIPRLALFAITVSTLFAADPVPRVAPKGSQQHAGGVLNEKVTVIVEHLDLLMKQAQAANTMPVLFLDGREITGVFGAQSRSVDAQGTGALTFILDRTSANGDAWKPLLSRPTLAPKIVALSVGLHNSLPIASAWPDFELEVIRKGWLALWLITFLGFGGACVFLAQKTSLLREEGTPPAGGKAAYSLAKCQMAWWFFWVVAAFMLLLMVTWDYNTITNGTLALIGISAGTGLAGAVVDSSTKNSLIAKLNAVPPPSPSEAAAIQKQIDTPASVNFLDDILTDSVGISFHRLQMLVWTLVLTVVFIGSVYYELIMPDFSATLLGLMGISSGTYVGFKFPETKN